MARCWYGEHYTIDEYVPTSEAVGPSGGWPVPGPDIAAATVPADCWLILVIGYAEWSSPHTGIFVCEADL